MQSGWEYLQTLVPPIKPFIKETEFIKTTKWLFAVKVQCAVKKKQTQIYSVSINSDFIW